MRVAFFAVVAVLVLLAACAAKQQATSAPVQSEADSASESQQESAAEDIEADDGGSAPVPQRTTTASRLDCDKIVLNEDLQAGCPGVAAADFTVIPMEDDEGNFDGCSYAKGASEAFVRIEIPDTSVPESIEAAKVGAMALDGKEPDSYDIGVKAYYSKNPRVRLFFGKEPYYVEILGGLPEDELCPLEGLQGIGRTILKRIG